VAADVTKNIGIMVNSQVDMSPQIRRICREPYIHLHKIGKIRHFLSTDPTATPVHTPVTAKLDNCNSVLYCCSESKVNDY